MIEKHKRLTSILILVLLLIGDIWLLYAFNTVRWPYLWPNPLLFILIGFIVFMMWFPELVHEKWLFRVVGIAMIFIGQSYTLHAISVTIEHFSILALLHAFGVLGAFFVMTVNFINQMSPKNIIEAPPLPDDLPHVAAVIPTYGEPVDILEQTAYYLTQLDYPKDRLHIFISDDGHRPEVELMTQRLGIHYNKGAQKNAKAGNLNSALKYLEENYPQAMLILTQDADEIIDSSFLKKVVGFFTDPKIAFVQTPKESLSPANDPFGVRDRVFYDVTQPGRNGSGAAFSCGSGVLWRIEAVKSIGGYATWNIVEDLTTSYMLHSAGWKSEYFNEILTIGLAPDDIPSLLKQRGTWATDNWRLFLFKNPITMPGLTLRQRFQYMELGLFYTTGVFFLPALMLVPLLSLLTGVFVPIEGSALFPWLFISLLYYYVFSKGNLHYVTIMMKYWVSHFWTYTKAFWLAVRSRNKKPSYKVTSKVRQAGFYGSMVWPQWLYVIAGFVAIIRGIFFLPEVALLTKGTNIAILMFFMYLTSSIVMASFYGVKLPHVKMIQSMRETFGIKSPSAPEH